MFGLHVNPPTAKKLALQSGLPYTSDVFAWSEHAGMAAGLLSRVGIQKDDRILILGDPFLHLSSSIANWTTSGFISVMEPNQKLYTFGMKWIQEHSLAITLQSESWSETKLRALTQDTTWVVFWDSPYRESEDKITTMLCGLKEYITQGGQICLRHTSPQYKEDHPQADELLPCPIIGLRRRMACPTFRYARMIAKKLECSYQTISSIAEPETYMTVFCRPVR